MSTFILVGRGTPNFFDSPRQVVSRGPYRFVRNPMYVAALLVLAAEFVVLSDMGVLLYALLLLMWLHFVVVAIAEPMLRDRFGAAYDEYCRLVPRWLPRRPGRA